MKKRLIVNFILALACATLLSAGFLLPHCGGFALVGFVPLLWMDYMHDAGNETQTVTGSRTRSHFFGWHYLTFVLWNAMTTFWVCNATIGGGIFAITANALQMSIIWAAFRGFKKHTPTVLPYIFLAAMWIAWERAYFSAEVSWPWLTLGNSFAGTTTAIQWYEYTGTLGGSLWVWACNLSIFALLVALRNGSLHRANKWKKAFLCGSPAVLVLVPLVVSWAMYARLEPVSEAQIQCAVLQPNLDPYQKFESLSQSEQNDVLQTLAMEAINEFGADETGLEAADSSNTKASVPSLLLAPETFTNDVFIVRGNTTPEPQSATVNRFQDLLASYPGTYMLMGATCFEFINQRPGDPAPSYTARHRYGGQWYEDHNSALLFGGRAGDCTTNHIQIYHKNRLVVGVEKMPWPRVMSKVDDMLGGVMGRCVGQDGVSLLYLPAGEIGCAICYESVYPEHFASFVKAGARAMTIITNDAWWGDTPGYRQHLNYARLRAIETRRDIARCANTGISAFINQRGDIVSQTAWWQRTQLAGNVNLNSQQTAFVTSGDIVGKLATFVFLLLCALLAVRTITSSTRIR